MAIKTQKSNRLSQEITPLHYQLLLQPNLKTFVFSGEEKISLVLSQPTKSIVLHAADLQIQKAEYQIGKEILKGRVVLDNEKEIATITFKKELKKGKGKLQLVFSGTLNDKMRGFYRSKYLQNNKEEYMATTQFESTDARRAFPCFDEPAMKATFQVSLIIPKETVAISNTMPEKTTTLKNEQKQIDFGVTPQMSTYLVAFIVGKFEYIETTTPEGVIVRVHATPGKKKQAEFALHTAAKMLSFFTKYFGIPYPLKSMQLIAIPDFASGAMENFGAVTYRESAILVDPVLSSTANKQWVALVIAHELAHQWFGNLVTMEWWTHLWLNEGFASYIEYLAVDHLFKEWDIWTQFVYLDHAKALSLDGLKNTHAIEIPVNHPSEISEIFDAVSYSKGASVIRMISFFIEEKAFQKGLQTYLKKHLYGNATTEDLWAVLQKTSGKPIKNMMTNWTGKPGYPLLSVSRTQKSLQVDQSRFFSSILSQKQGGDTTLWSIPINSISQTSKKSKVTLISKKTTVIDAIGNGWYKLNSGEYSFVRVKYPSENLLLLGKAIQSKDKKLSEIDKFGIIRDAFALAEAGELNTHEVLSLVLAYKEEESYIIWAEIATHLGKLHDILATEDFYGAFKAYERDVFAAIFKKVGWDKKAKESYTTALLRSITLGALGRAGDKDVIKEAVKRFGEITEGKTIDPDLRSLVYFLYAKNGGHKEYKIVKALYEKATLQEEKDRFLRALCAFESEKLLDATLAYGFSDKVRAQDMFRVVAFVFGNPYGRDLTWNFIKKNWKEIFEKFNGGHLMTRFISPTENFTTLEKAKEVETFFKKHQAPGIERTVLQAVEQIKANAMWIQKDRKQLRSFLLTSTKVH